jgi:hypothetical protein
VGKVPEGEVDELVNANINAKRKLNIQYSFDRRILSSSLLAKKKKTTELQSFRVALLKSFVQL